jgi:hypothetical protein
VPAGGQLRARRPRRRQQHLHVHHQLLPQVDLHFQPHEEKGDDRSGSECFCKCIHSYFNLYILLFFHNFILPCLYFIHPPFSSSWNKRN